MGILEKLKEKFKLKDYKEMTPTEMLSLDDENLTEAIWHRYLSELVGEPVANVLAELSGARRVYYILYTFDMLAGIGMKGEVYCLENDKDILPFLISALEEVGAYENKRLVEDLKQAAVTNTSKSMLDSKLHCIGNSERKGVCHMLVNDNKLRWVNEE